MFENEKLYIVQETDGDEFWTAMMPSSRMIDHEDLSDCTGYRMTIWEPAGFGELIPITLHGCWHNPKNPLYIKATRPDGSIAFDGYGTDH